MHRADVVQEVGSWRDYLELDEPPRALRTRR
jgi:hypothetical protein